jgi:uncharacterized membrane protein
MGRNLLIGVGALVLIGVMYFLFGGMTGSVVAELVDDGDVVRFSLDGIGEEAQFFEYGGAEFFVVRAGNGAVKTAFDACDVCYKSKKGYRQEGGDMVCNNCGNHYKISGLGTKNLRGGGCWPGYLPNSVEGNELVIKKSDLEAGRYRFN